MSKEARNDLAVDPDAVPGVDDPDEADDADESENQDVVPPDLKEQP